MPRSRVWAAVAAATVSACLCAPAFAQPAAAGGQPSSYWNGAPYAAGTTGGPASHATYYTARTAQDNGPNGEPAEPRPPAGTPGVAAAPVPPMPVAGGYPVLPGYPYLNAAMHPTPQPYIPFQMGGTVITNQALYPHEMLYPHRYRAIYPPYYYKVHGGWVVTPWGVWSQDHWKLQGTEVRVNYRSSIHPFAGFSPPKKAK